MGVRVPPFAFMTAWLLPLLMEAPTACGPLYTSSAQISHLEGSGIGYDRGYSSTDLFAMRPLGHFLPFLDLRGHVFNDGRLAANAGAGLRFFQESRPIGWGTNIFFDYREAAHKAFHQVSFGLELLGSTLGVCANAYLPIGRTKSPHFGLRFSQFVENTLLLQREREYALSGVDVHFFAHSLRINELDFAATGGPYAFWGQHGQRAIGGQLRLSATVYSYLQLEAQTAYDSLFGWTGHGRVALTCPFGKPLRYCRPIDQESHKLHSLLSCLVQPVQREEILIVKTRRKRTIAINPATGAPFQLFFVNNTSHSAGTFQSPFSTLAAAEAASGPYSILYVFPGDGTSAGMNSGLVLKEGQRLLGAGTSHTLLTPIGTLTIPPLAPNQPLLTTSSGSVITCSNNNEIAGIHIQAANEVVSIQGSGITNLLVRDSTIDLAKGSIFEPNKRTMGVQLTSSTGSLVVRNNTFYGLDDTRVVGVWIASSAPGASYLVEHNQFLGPSTGISRTTGIELGHGVRSAPSVSPTRVPLTDFDRLVLSSNQFIRLGSAAQQGKAIGGAGVAGTAVVIIDRNYFLECSSGASNGSGSPPQFNTGIITLRIGAPASITTILAGNVWEHSIPSPSPSFTVYALTVENQAPSTSSCVLLEGNQADSDALGYLLTNDGTRMTTDIRDNVGEVIQIDTTPGSCQ